MAVSDVQEFVRKCRTITDLHNMVVLRKIVEDDTKFDINGEYYYIVRTSAAHGHLDFVEYLLPLCDPGAVHPTLLHAIRRGHDNIYNYIVNGGRFDVKFDTFKRGYSVAVETNNEYLMDKIIEQIKIRFPEKILDVVSTALAITIRRKNYETLHRLYVHAGRKNWRTVVDMSLLHKTLRASDFDKLLSYGADVGYDNYACSQQKYKYDVGDKIKKRINVLARCQ